MSYREALDVLGISQVIAEEARAKFLGKLGVRTWGNPPIPQGEVRENGGACGGRECGSALGVNCSQKESGLAPLHGDGPSPTEVFTDELISPHAIRWAGVVVRPFLRFHQWQSFSYWWY